MAVRGIALIDLIGVPARLTSALPPDMLQLLRGLSAVNYWSQRTDQAFIHRGRVMPLAQLPALTRLRGSPAEVPLLHTGVPFVLCLRRSW